MERTASFGEWVRRRRKALDLTQAALARQVGCAEVTIKKIEADERRPSRQIALRLADSLQLGPAERAAFVQAARGELAADRLDLPPPPEAVAAALPGGTLTFLFTDIEGSTRLWEQHAEAMQRALARHDALVCQAIAAHHGVVFKTTGDGVHAAFTTALHALSAALEAQRAVQAESWGSIGPIRVRMALHTGVAEVRDGDYFGPALNRVARLLAAGHGGQILLSRATQELVCEHLPPDVELQDLGAHHLKDLTRPEHIFQALAPDLPADFPPLTTLDTRSNNLPAQPTPLIGREAEVVTACALLRRDDVRLLTLVGPGGVGKTRLGLQVAAELLDDFADGVSFVNLAPINDTDLVASTIAQTLGVFEMGDQLYGPTMTSGSPLIERLKNYLGTKHLLLILDNFEQLLAAAPLVADLLAAAPRLNVLATSRAVLHLSGEHEFVVPPLTLPDPTHLPPLKRLTQYPAVVLFIQRAQALKPDFTVTNATAPAVAAICHRLDGLPLAIELAAARVKLLPPQALLVRLDQTLKVLTGGARDAPARQQTMRAAIDWSYHLLDAGEQTLFARLGVFVGSGTLAAAEAVCNADRDLPLDVLDGVAALVDKSLLRQAEGKNGEPRFTMLETIREYALDRLEQSGEADTIRRRHAEYFLALAEATEPKLLGPDQMAWFDRLEQEHDNLRAALTWSCTAQGDAEIGLRIVGALNRFWQVHAHYVEGFAWVEKVLLQSGGTPAARAKALHVVGAMSEGMGNFVRARSFIEESLALYRNLGDVVGTAHVLFMLGRTACWQGDYVRAEALHAESLALSREQNNSWVISWLLLSLGDVAFNRNEMRQAERYFQEALMLCQDRGDKSAIAWAIMNLGRVAHAQSDDALAQAYLAQGRALFEELNERTGIASVFLDMARVSGSQGDSARAERYYVESLAQFREYMDKLRIPECFEGLAGLACAAGQPARAARLFGAAEALRECAGMPLPPVLRADYDHDVAAVRAQLDAATSAAAWAAGRAMPLEQAIAEVLDQAP